MPVIVVTRLRLKDPDLFTEFFESAVAVVEQAKHSHGNVAADVLADANFTFWTRTAWESREVMNGFVGSEPHRRTMVRIDRWCDEATFVDWDHSGAEVPSWQEGYERLARDGQVTTLTNGTAAHQSRQFPPPVDTS
jgi:hypothetical protein